MREPKRTWVRALRALTGFEQDDIRYNETVGRWEFVLTCGDGVPRSQFWCVYKNPLTGEPIKPDPMTGLQPFRELDDETMRDALTNLESTFVANPFDGAGTTKKEVMKRIRENRAEGNGATSRAAMTSPTWSTTAPNACVAPRAWACSQTSEGSVQLKEWDHDAGLSGRFVGVEYPDKIIQDFIDYFRTTHRWREEPEIVYARWMVFERELTDVRNQAATLAAAGQCTAETKSGDPCRITNSVEDGLCAIHRRASRAGSPSRAGPGGPQAPRSGVRWASRPRAQLSLPASAGV